MWRRADLPRAIWLWACASLALIMASCAPAPPVSKPTAPHPAALGHPVNGKIISWVRLPSYDGHVVQGVRIYRIRYWSQGVAVSAYLSEPSQPGHYPLLVNMHGGWVYPAHRHSNFGYTAADVFSLVNPGMVQLYPDYQGYGQSQGLVHGIATDVQNTLDGIAAAKALGEVNASRLYLVGVSVGGGVALMVAGDMPKATRAVVAVSPWVGLVDNMAWLSAHQAGHLLLMSKLVRQYGPDIPGPPTQVYQAESPSVAAIQAPVLLLQGTADHHVIWQTVQLFAAQLKAAGKTYRLILDPGGHHGLKHHYLTKTASEVESWFQKYGLNFITY